MECGAVLQAGVLIHLLVAEKVLGPQGSTTFFSTGLFKTIQSAQQPPLQIPTATSTLSFLSTLFSAG